MTTFAASTKSIEVTARKDSYMERAGWDRIMKIEIDTFLDGYDRIDFRILWLTDAAGNVWEATALKGETEEQLADLFARRGYTNDRCCMAFPAQA